MTLTRHFAHSSPTTSDVHWHGLEDHLREVSLLASRFAEAFDAAEWGRLTGLWHDLGKYQAGFQAHLRGDPRTVDHSVVGALLANSKRRDAGLPLAFAIAAHHGGLPNIQAADGTPQTPLLPRLQANRELLNDLLACIPPAIRESALPDLPERFKSRSQAAVRSAEFWIRFLFSALVDADFLDTEAFFSPDRKVARAEPLVPISELRCRLDDHLSKLVATSPHTAVNAARAEVLRACRCAAALAPGTFSLSAPTGAGKTFSTMAFALHHAERHSLRRVIVVVPYTSILDSRPPVRHTHLHSGDRIGGLPVIAFRNCWCESGTSERFPDSGRRAVTSSFMLNTRRDSDEP